MFKISMLRVEYKIRGSLPIGKIVTNQTLRNVRDATWSVRSCQTDSFMLAATANANSSIYESRHIMACLAVDCILRKFVRDGAEREILRACCE